MSEPTLTGAGPGTLADAPPGTPAPAPATGPGRHRSWLLAALVALTVVGYLIVWSTYATTHTSDRYRQLALGAAGERFGADLRLLSLVRSDRLQDSDGGDPQLADPGATFVVARLELVQHRVEEFFGCQVDLVGTDQRLWETTSLKVDRTGSCSSDDVVLQQPYRFEAVFSVPLGDADALAGVALSQHLTSDRQLLLRPPT